MSEPTSPDVATPPSRIGAWVCAVLGLVWWIGAAALRADASVWLILMGLLATGALIWFGRGLGAPDPWGPALAARRGPLLLAVATAVVVTVVAPIFQPAVLPAVATMGVGLLADQVSRAVGVRAYGTTGRFLVAIGAVGVLLGTVTGRGEVVLAVVGLLGAVAWWAVPTSALLQRFAARRSGGTPFRLTDDQGRRTDQDPEPR